MPSVIKLAIIAAKNLKSKLFAKPKGTGKFEIPVKLGDIKT